MGEEDIGGISAPFVASSSNSLQDKYAYDYDLFEFEVGDERSRSVKGGLAKKVPYWEDVLGANREILKILKVGYKLPFAFTPKSVEFKNNKSSLKNQEFVSEAITKLLKDGLVKESLIKPEVVSLLSVAENKGKKRLILDLRYVNTHLIKGKIKYDDQKCFENYLIKKYIEGKRKTLGFFEI